MIEETHRRPHCERWYIYGGLRVPENDRKAIFTAAHHAQAGLGLDSPAIKDRGTTRSERMKTMNDETIQFEVGSGNVYADWGFPDAEDMLIKAQLTFKIGEIIKARRWSQQKAAEVIGIPQPKLSEILRGHFRGVSAMKLLDGLARLGRDIPITVGPARRRTTPGQVSVVFR